MAKGFQINWGNVEGFANDKNYSSSYEKKKKKRKVDLALEKNDTKAIKNLVTKDELSSILETGAYEPFGLAKTSKDDKWFNTKLFDDGYNFGDVSKTILGTGTKIAQDYVKGVQSNTEGFMDFGTNLLSMGTEALGLDDTTSKLREFAQKDFIADKDLVNKTIKSVNPMLALVDQVARAKDNLEDGYDLGDLILKNNQVAGLFQDKDSLSKAMDKIAENSITGGKLDNLAQTVGQISGQSALTMANLPWQVTAFANSAGGEMNNAFQNNASAGEAFISGLISGLSEVGTEYIGSGTNKLFGMESLGSKGLAKLGSKISNKVASRIIKMGIDSSSEGLEEVLSGLGTALGQKLTYMSDKDFEELYSKDQALDDFVMGALGTIISNVPGQARSIARGENAFSGLTQNEQTVLDKVIEERTNEAQKDGKELSKKEIKEIEDQAREDLQNGYISADMIEETLGDNFNVDKDVVLREAFNERARRRNSFNTDLSQYKNENQRKIVQKAIDSGILNDSKKTHNFVDLVSKIASDKGMDFDFVNNQKIIESGFGVKGKTVNGYVNGNTIGLNIESNNALNKTVGHEITHVLEGSELYQALQDSLKSYVGEDTWNKRIKELSETYKNVKNADVTKELIADLVGENLFNNEDFVRSLSVKNRNLFEKIFDEIKYLVRIATAGSKEKRDLVKLQKTFEEAYRDSKTTKEGTQYSLEQNYRGSHQIEDGTSIVNLDLNNIRNQIEEIDGYITRETEKDFNKLKKILNNPEESVKIYRAAPVGELNNGDWVTTDKSYAKNVANNNGGKVYEYEVKANELNYPSDIKELPSLHRLSSFQYTGENLQNVKYSLTDNQGRKLTEQQQEFFKDSKVRDEDGNLKVMYHGSKHKHYVSNTSNGMVWVTSNKSYAEAFNKRIDTLYANITNPLFIGDIDGVINDESIRRLSEYTDINENTLRDIAKQKNGVNIFNITNSREFRDLIAEKGFDGLEAIEGRTKSYAVFNSNQIKNVDNKAPTSNPDIRYSLTDNQGKQLTPEQQEYFKDSKLRNDNGELEVVYHTTPNKFTVFDTNKAGENTGYDNTAFGSFITTNKNFSQRFGDINGEGNKGNTMELYANITKPITHPYNAYYKYSGKELDNIVENWYKAIGEKEALNELKEIAQEENTSLYDTYMDIIMTDLDSPFEYAEEEKKVLKKKGYDGVEFVEGLDKDVNYGVSEGNEPVSSYAIFNSEQLKNIDNLNPTTNKDIRYSLTDNQGRELTKEQQEYFKDSKVRDDDGNLLEMSHVSNNEFTTFKGSNIEIWENGNRRNESNGLSYFTNEKKYIEGIDKLLKKGDMNNYGYGKRFTKSKTYTYKTYLNITNPLDLTIYSQKMTPREWQQILKEKGIDLSDNEISDYSVYNMKYDPKAWDYNNTNFYQMIKHATNDFRQKLLNAGFDGIKYYDTLEENNVDKALVYITTNPNQIKNIDNKAPTSNPDIRYSLSVQEANTGTDNQGRKLTEGQMVKFGNSKTTDENGNLVTVYHTTTNEVAQFNEFNPVGTPYYRFGDQVVNYFSDSKDMSGSYASQDYKMADTKKLENINDVQNYLHDIAISTNNRFNIKEENGRYQLLEEKTTSKEAKDFINSLTEEEMQQMRDNIYVDEKMAGTPYERAFEWDKFDKELQTKFNSALDKYMGSADLVDLQQEMMRYIENPSLMVEDNNLNGNVIGSYESQEEMFKKLKEDIGRGNWSKNTKIQYEGYVNITNPYIVDAEKRNWNQVIQQSNDFIDELDERVPEDVKNNLTRLYNESANKSNDARDTYETTENILRGGIDGYLSSVDETIQKVNNVVRAVGFQELNSYLENDVSPGVNFWYDIANELEHQGLIGSASRSFIIDEFRLPEQVKDLIKDNYNKKIQIQQIQTDNVNKVVEQLGKEFSLKELYEKNYENYQEFDKYRMPNYYFMEQIQAEDNDYLGYELNDMFETRAETIGAEAVGEEISQAASVGFSKPELIRLWGTSKTTNDVVKEVIASNKDGTTNYDGIIFKNVVDYGGKSGTEVQANDVYVTFNSNQFKAVDNLNPTDDPDIRYQLGTNEIAPTRGWDVRGRDIALESAIAPLQEQVQQLQNTIDDLRDNIAPITEEEADNLPTDENIQPPMRYNLTPEESQRLDILDLLERNDMLTDEQRQERNDLMEKEENAPVGEDMTPIESLTDVRDIDEVGDRKVKAYQYEHPEVKPYFQEEARKMLADLNNSTKGEKFAIPGKSQNINDWEWIGLKRQTSPEIEMLLDGDLGVEYSYDDIRKGLNAIIEDHGAENIAVAKRIEFLLDERLRNGYEIWDYGGIMKDEYGNPLEVAPNQDYLNMLREQSWEKYYEESPWLENAPAEIEEPVIKMTPEEVASNNDLDNLEIDMTPFNDMINQGQENEVVRTINNNYNGIVNDLVEQGLPLDAAQHTIQNVVNKYDNQYNRVKQKDTNKGQKMILDAQEKITNRNAYIDKMAKDYNNENIKWKGDLANNSFGQAKYNIEQGQTDLDGNEIGKAVDKIFEPYKKQGLLAVAEDYLFNRSNIERHKVGKGSTVPLEVSQRLVKEYLAQYPQLKNLTEDIQKYYNNLLQLEVDSGLVDQSQYNFLRGEKGIYRSYVPFYPGDAEKRYFDNKGNLKPAKTLKRAKGGASKIMGIQEAMRKQTMAVWNSMRTNQLYQEIVNTLGGDEGLGAIIRNDPTNLTHNLYTDTDGTKYLTAFVDGREVSTKISEELYNELSRNNENRIRELEQTYSPISKALQWVSNLRRNLLTSYNPVFALYKNPFKDIQDATYYSKHTAKMLKNLPGSYPELLTNKSKTAQQFRALYGTAEYKGPGKLYAMISELIELAPRYAEFKASLESGETALQAIYNAREVTTNFGRGGYVTKALNRNGFTFLNASVQGFSKFIRNFTEQPNAKQFTMAVGKAAMLGIIPAIFNHLAFGDDDEDYEALPNYIKDNYYLFKKADGTFARIPKGRALSVMGSAARRTLEAANGDEEAFEGYLKNAWSQIGPVELGESPLDNTIAAPIAQALGGAKTKDGRTVGRAWYGGDIVPSRLQDKPSNEQYDESTDKFSIWLSNTKLGKKLGLSPYKVNYVIDQYTGGIGDTLLPIITEESTNGAETPMEYLIAPVKDQLVVNSTDDNKYVSKFYDTRAKMNTRATSDEATDEDLLRSKYLDDISWEMTSLYQEKREIQSDSSLSKKEKFERSQEIKKEINRLAKEGLDNYKNVSQTGSYSEVNGNEYQKTDEGWKKVKDTDSTSINTYGLDDGERNTYFKTKSNISNIKSQYKDSKDYAGRKSDIINEIRSSNLPDDAKIGLYQDTYNDKNAQRYVDAGISADDYLDFKSHTFSADKDKNGKSISGSKKKKVFNYIQNMNIPFEQKVMLVKTEYPTYNEYNKQVINYLNNSGIDYDTMVDLLEDMGFTVNGNDVTW